MAEEKQHIECSKKKKKRRRRRRQANNILKKQIKKMFSHSDEKEEIRKQKTEPDGAELEKRAG